MKGLGSILGSMTLLFAVHSEAAPNSCRLPESSTMEGIHYEDETWTTMTHGFVNAIYDHQGGPRVWTTCSA